jgi:hypothetical protein
MSKTLLRHTLIKKYKNVNWNHNFKTIMDFVEEYTEKWVQREEVELDILSE